MLLFMNMEEVSLAIVNQASRLPFFCFFFKFYNRKRGSASYIVREVRSVREREREREIQRERERERERDGSDVTLVALKLAMSFALFLAKNVHLSFSPL